MAKLAAGVHNDLTVASKWKSAEQLALEIDAKLLAAGIRGMTLSGFRWKANSPARRAGEEALRMLVASRRVFPVHGRPKRWIHRNPLIEWLGVDAPAPVQSALDSAEVLAAYRRLVAAHGWQDVRISELRDESGADLDQLQQRLRQWVGEGRAVLSRGDASLAGEAEKAAAIDWLGHPQLLVRLTTP